MSDISLNKYIDHTILAPSASRDDVLRAVDEGVRHNVASVCVNACWVELVVDKLRGTGIGTCAAIGFPLGATLTSVKAFEAAECVERGATEVDMVLNVGFVKSGDWEAAMRDIEAVVKAVRGRALVKVILETCLLTDEEKVRACEIAEAACADYVKTSTGFSAGGATEADVSLMRRSVGAKMGVKASGGVRTREQAEAMIRAGATRIGASATAKILG